MLTLVQSVDFIVRNNRVPTQRLLTKDTDSLRYLALAEATIINFLAPTIAILLLYLLSRQPSILPPLYAGFVSIIGLLFVVKPWSPHPIHTPLDYGLAVGMAIVGVAGAAVSYVVMSTLGRRVHPIITVGYFATICTALNVLFLGFSSDTQIDLPGSTLQWFLVISLGVMGFIMNWLLTASLADGKESGVVLNCVYSQIVFALLADKLIWNILPDALGYLGSFLILCSVLYVTNSWKGSTKNRVDEV
jgi:drug/metabolite transporter (DMT)-like permease